MLSQEEEDHMVNAYAVVPFCIISYSFGRDRFMFMEMQFYVEIFLYEHKMTLSFLSTLCMSVTLDIQCFLFLEFLSRDLGYA